MNETDYSFFKSQGFTFKKVIGRGSYGVIFLVHSKHYNQFFAVKRVLEINFNQSEIDLIKFLDHPNIVNLYNYGVYKKHFYMIMEYCPNNIYNAIKHTFKHGLPEDILITYTYNILSAIRACHERSIAHQDIKPSNFLIDSYGRVKACDFGLSKQVDDKELTVQCPGSYMFMAPEILKKLPHDPIKGDIWALGVTFYFMATRTYPWEFDNLQRLIKKIETKKLPKDINKINPLYASLIEKCLTFNPNERPTINELIAMPIFDTLNAQKAQSLRRARKTRTLSFNSRQGIPIIKPFLSPQKLVMNYSAKTII